MDRIRNEILGGYIGNFKIGQGSIGKWTLGIIFKNRIWIVGMIWGLLK